MNEDTPDDAWAAADLSALSAIDPDIAAQLQRLGSPNVRRAPQGLATLVRIVLGQQVSTKAAATVFGRVEQACSGVIDARALRELGEPGLRACGLSGRKTSYILDLAASVTAGEIDIAAWPTMPDSDVIAAITAMRGFGRWSADIYLMFALERRDILPAEDLAVRVGYQRLRGLEAPPDAKVLRQLTTDWQPFRSAASLLLWRLYGATTLDLA